MTNLVDELTRAARAQIDAEIVVVEAATRDALAKRDDTPSKVEDTERLNRYWTEGEGAAKIDWGVDGDFDRCLIEVGKYIDDPEEAKGHCANLHHRATGFWPGHAPGESKSGGHKKAISTDKTIALGEELHDRIVDHYAPLLADAMRDSVSDADLLSAVHSAQNKQSAKKAAGDDEETTTEPGAIAGGKPEMTPITSDIATGAISSNIAWGTQGIQSTLENLYGDAGLVGAGIGAQQIGDVPAGNDFAAILPGINWSTWHPGDLDAARYVANGKLQEVLDDLDITIRGMTDSAMDRMGTVLANGLNEGLAPKTIAANMKDVIADPKRAEVVARTETARAQGASNLSIYQENGSEQWDWHANLGACPICLGYESDSPYPIDGGPGFPGHPNCRCQPLPHVGDS